MKIEIVITRWDDNKDFKSRDLISSDNIHGIRDEFEAVMNTIETKIQEELEIKNKMLLLDDDIPF